MIFDKRSRPQTKRMRQKAQRKKLQRKHKIIYAKMCTRVSTVRWFSEALLVYWRAFLGVKSWFFLHIIQTEIPGLQFGSQFISMPTSEAIKI